MKKCLVAILLVYSCSTFSQTNSYENAWTSLNENKRADAEKYLEQAMQDPSLYQDAFITELYLKSYNKKEDQTGNFVSSFYKKSPNPYPYIYALWSNKAVVGPLGKKTTSEQIDLMNALIADKKVPGTLVAAANYNEKMHYLFSGEFGKTAAFDNAIGNIKDWQFTGPFENLSRSGFYKDYGPLEHPEPAAVFKSVYP